VPEKNPYAGPNLGKVVGANNVIIGDRADLIHGYMTNGIFLVN